MNTFAAKIKHEFLELLPPTIFFFIAFQLLAFSRSLMLRQYDIRFSALPGVTLGALLVAKAILLSDLLPFMKHLSKKPLLHNILWKTLIYGVVSLFLHYLEHLIPIWWHTDSFDQANRRLQQEIIWPHFWVIQLWLLVLLLGYCTARETIRLVGLTQIKKIFLTPPALIPHTPPIQSSNEKTHNPSPN
jgi:hypothetical protein